MFKKWWLLQNRKDTPWEAFPIFTIFRLPLFNARSHILGPFNTREEAAAKAQELNQQARAEKDRR